MKRDALKELHYITAIANLPSILRNGILSHTRVAKLDHVSVASSEIQERRARVKVPGGRRLHDYVNLYINARNAMLRSLQSRHRELCVLRINPKVLDLSDVIIADKNAATRFVKWLPSPDGLEEIDGELLFREFWTDPTNPFVDRRNRQARMAEVLVPDRVEPSLIVGAYVSCAEARDTCARLVRDLPISVDQHLFMLY